MLKTDFEIEIIGEPDIRALPESEQHTFLETLLAQLVNSDKNCFILKKITVAEKEYTPDSQYLVSKEEIFQIRIFEDEIPNVDCKIVLVVEDQNGNEWLYNLIKNGTNIISMKAQTGDNL